MTTYKHNNIFNSELLPPVRTKLTPHSHSIFTDMLMISHVHLVKLNNIA
jgi:hypothetical protein